MDSVPNGVCLIHVIIRESHLDTNATTSSIRMALTVLDDAMVAHGHDIKSFNLYVQSLIQHLVACGQQSDDLLVNLFKGYKACVDHEFIWYIKQKKRLQRKPSAHSHAADDPCTQQVHRMR